MHCSKCKINCLALSAVSQPESETPIKDAIDAEDYQLFIRSTELLSYVLTLFFGSYGLLGNSEGERKLHCAELAIAELKMPKCGSTEPQDAKQTETRPPFKGPEYCKGALTAARLGRQFDRCDLA
jgi:hypothetical protein